MPLAECLRLQTSSIFKKGPGVDSSLGSKRFENALHSVGEHRDHISSALNMRFEVYVLVDPEASGAPKMYVYMTQVLG